MNLIIPSIDTDELVQSTFKSLKCADKIITKKP